MKRIRAQITVLASLIIVLVLSLVCTCIRSAAVSVVKTNINMACNLSIESIFAGYSRPLLDEFDVMYLKDSQQLESRLQDYISKNMMIGGSFNKLELYSTQVDEKVLATDNNGENLKDEVLEYMKYGVISDISQLVLNSEKDIKKSEKTEEIIEEIVECEEDTTRIDQQVLELVMCIEGLKTDDDGFVIRRGKPVVSGESFGKQIVIGGVTASKAEIDNQTVYDVMRSEYIDIGEITDDITANADGIIEDGNELSEESAINSYNSIYRRNYDDLENAVSSARKSMEQALNITKEYETTVNKVKTHVSGCKTKVTNSKSIIGNELAEGFLSDLNEISDFDESKENIMCRISELRSGLLYNIKVLDEAMECVNSMNQDLTVDSAKDIQERAVECEQILASLDYSKLKFNYTNIDFSANQKGMKLIDGISKFMKKGILSLIISDFDSISVKKINFKDLASSGGAGNVNNKGNIVISSKDNVMYNEYLFMKFNSYKDSAETQAYLDYVLEYILCGKSSDKDNLEATVIKLLAIREGTNLAYLFTDREKKNESYALALALFGFTGMPAVVKAGQYAIMAAWAYGEAILDVKALCDGNNVELVKNRDCWKLSLENLINKKIVGDKNDASGDKTKGCSYEGYLRILLFIEKESNKYFRTMDSIEMRMMEKGYESFRMKNYIYSMCANATFKINNNNNFHIQQMDYHY